MADISKITTPNGTTYDIKDATGRKEAYLEWGGKNFAASYGCIDAAMVDELGANRLAFTPDSAVTIEYTRDGGSTWTDYGATTAVKKALFSSGTNVYIGKADSSNKATANGTKYQLRITLNTGTGHIYTALNKFIFYVSTNGSSSPTVTIQKALESTPDTYIDVATNVGISGWSGYNVINIDTITTYGNTAASQYGRLRFIFKANGGNTNYIGLNVLKIMGFGGVGWYTPSTMAKTGHLYSFDESGNATFPANVTATYVKGNISQATGLTKAQVTTALGYTPVNQAGDTITGVLNIKNTASNKDAEFNITQTNGANNANISVGQQNVGSVGFNMKADGTKDVFSFVGSTRYSLLGFDANNNFTSGVVKEYIDNAIKASTIDIIYPVGSIFMSVNNVNPGTYLSGTTWEVWGSGRVPVGVDTSQTEFDTVEKTGGAKTNSYTPAGKNTGGAVSNTTLTIDQIPSHTHNSARCMNDSPGESPKKANCGSGSTYGFGYTKTDILGKTGGGKAHGHGFTQPTFTGTAADISTVQPYITCYMWKRTA